MIGAVVVAHDEERSIGRCLGALLRDARPGEFDVVVVCNGCTDRTAEIAATFAPDVRVVELPVASKIAALNAGDAVVRGFPRLYIDGDVALDTDDARRLAAALGQGGLLAVSPRVAPNLAGRPASVRAYYRLWQHLPGVRAGCVGAGVYALSEAGRARFGRFPDVVADDYFVQCQFTDGERDTVATATARVEVPRTLAALVRRKVRVVAGNAAVEDAGLGAGPRRGGVLATVRSRPRLALDVPAFVVVTALARAGAAWRRSRGAATRWDRDHTTR